MAWRRSRSREPRARVHVYVDRSRVESLGLSLLGLAQQLGAEGFDLPGGRVSAGAAELTVRTSGRYRSLEELGSVVVASLANGSQVRLVDVARIEDGFKDARTRSRLDGKDAVTLDVQKQGGANTVATADAVYRKVAELERSLPKDATVSDAVDSSIFIRRNARDVTEAIVFGGAMAILVIFLFMLDWRSTLISSLALPTSVVTTFLVMKWLGFTFNIMSLMGLARHRAPHRRRGGGAGEHLPPHGAREDPSPPPPRDERDWPRRHGHHLHHSGRVRSGGLHGDRWPDVQAVRPHRDGGGAGLALRLLHAGPDDVGAGDEAHLARPPPGARQPSRARPIARAYERADSYYRRSYRSALGPKVGGGASALAIFAGSLLLLPIMGKEFVTPADRGEFRVTLETAAGTSLDEMDRVTRQVEALLRENKEVRSLFAVVGPDEEVNKASIRVYGTKAKERPSLSQWDIMEDVRERLAKVPGIKSTVADLPMFEGPVQELPITMFIRGDDYEALHGGAGQALQLVRACVG